MTERQKLMRDVQMYDFALLEAGEYLDGHPRNPDAISYFNQQKKLYDAAVEAYTQRFGPLQYKQGLYNTSWTWVDDPWPWEGADH